MVLSPPVLPGRLEVKYITDSSAGSTGLYSGYSVFMLSPRFSMITFIGEWIIELAISEEWMSLSICFKSVSEGLAKSLYFSKVAIDSFILLLIRYACPK